MNSQQSRRLLILAAFALAIVWAGAAAHHVRGVWGFALLVPLVVLLWLTLRRRDPTLHTEMLSILFGGLAVAGYLERDYLSFFGWGFIGAWFAYDWVRATDGATITVACVKAPRFAGVVEYLKLHLPGVRVEECSKDWMERLSQTETDDEGRFALADAPEPQVRYLSVSYPGAKTAYLQVGLSPTTQPLLVRLESR
ncbi:MAG: hypothetical protein ABSH46_09885 [Bryobacteraceae bacterium]